jgi:hypothetical protein
MYHVISVYIDAGIGNTNPVTLNFVTSGPSFPRNWKVKICQIPCNTIYRGKHHFQFDFRITVYDKDCHILVCLFICLLK